MEEKITEKQKQIFEAAIEVFSDKGFSAASTSEIAKLAGVAEGTVFKRYSTKKDLLLGIGIYIASKLSIPHQIRELESVLSKEYENVEDLLRAFLKNRLEFAQKHRKLLKVALQEIPFHPELRDLLREAIETRIFPIAEKAVKRYQQSGQLRNLSAKTILRMIASQFFSYALLRNFVAPDKAWNDKKEVDQIVDVLMNGLSNHAPSVK